MGDQCPDENALAALVDGNLRPREIRELESHILRCRDCYETIVFVLNVQEQFPEYFPRIKTNPSSDRRLLKEHLKA